MAVVERYLGSSVLRWGMLAFLVVSAGWLTFGTPAPFPVPYRIDIDVYRTGAQVFLDGGAVYGPLPQLSQGAHLPFTYPPIAAVLFTVFTVMPLPVASTLLTLASIAGLVVVVRIGLRQTCERPSAELWWLVVAAVGIGLWFGPIRETLAFGQINTLLMALVVVDAILGRGRWWGGTLIGLAIAIKLTPAVFLLLLVLRRDWRMTATTVVSFFGYNGIGHVLMPKDSLEYWTQTLADTSRIGGAAFASNQSINAVLHRLGLEGSTRTLAWFVTAMLVGLLVAWVAGRLLAHGHDLAATITVGFAALFCSPISWGHHWVWSLPLVVLMLVWATRQHPPTRRWLWLAGSGTFVFLTTPQWWFPNGNDAELQWNPAQQLIGSSYLVWGLVALLVMGVSASGLGRADRAATSTVLWPSLFTSNRVTSRDPGTRGMVAGPHGVG